LTGIFYARAGYNDGNASTLVALHMDEDDLDHLIMVESKAVPPLTAQLMRLESRNTVEPAF
jgi:hypothetical protein